MDATKDSLAIRQPRLAVEWLRSEDPKGVLLHHRGAYLKSVHLIVKWPLHRHSVSWPMDPPAVSGYVVRPQLPFPWVA